MSKSKRIGLNVLSDELKQLLNERPSGGSSTSSAVQTWQQSCSGDSPLNFNFYLPESVITLHKVLLTFKSSVENPGIIVKVKDVDETHFLSGVNKITSSIGSLDITPLVNQIDASNQLGHTKIELIGDVPSKIDVSIFVQVLVDSARKSIIVGNDA